MKMTAEQQRIAIAEACGWLLDHINRSAMYYVPSMDCHVGDPLSDLNAMHEAEKVLNEAYLWNRYKGWLLTWMTEPIRATAPQRCEAFLRTINKWTND